MNANEVEFLGEKSLINIIPNFNFAQIHLISGSIGPFRAGLPVSVPMWLAINLKQQLKCRIMRPDWMELENLNAVKENEKSRKDFSVMPSDHYMDVANVLLNLAVDDIPDVDSIRTVIKDIWDIRMSKLRTSIDEFFKDQSGTHARLDNLTSMELLSIKPLLPHAMDQLLRINMTDDRITMSQLPESQSQ